MEASIRRATSEDYSALCDLFEQLDALHRDSLPDIFRKPLGPAREQDYFLGLIVDENVGFFVAETGGQLAGFVHAFIKDTPAIPILVERRYAVVDAVVVKPGFAGHGIGSMLMRRVHQWALAEGAASIELNVYEFNESAISFYEELGYRTLSRKMRKDLTTKQDA